MVLVICTLCGTETEAHRRTRKYCDTCTRARHTEVARESAARQPKRDRSVDKSKCCNRCGSDFVTQKDYQKYCNDCRASADGASPHHYLRTGGEPMPVAANCKHCGETFQPRAIRQKFCTRKCWWASRSSAPMTQINNRMRAGIHSTIKAKKAGHSWQRLVGYSAADLMRHLERQFLPGMSWENIGEWHIDHRVPLASFQYTAPADPEFKAAWGLPNLQPLWATDNIKKRDLPVYLL